MNLTTIWEECPVCGHQIEFDMDSDFETERFECAGCKTTIKIDPDCNDEGGVVFALFVDKREEKEKKLREDINAANKMHFIFSQAQQDIWDKQEFNAWMRGV